MSDPYCYDNGTLRNRFGIIDADELAAVEARVSVQRLSEIESQGFAGRFDLDHLCAIHRHIFDDVYEWAGELRTVDLAKGHTLFCLARFLTSAARDVFTTVPAVQQELSDSDGLIPAAVAELYADLNALHPFREGNGRAQRAFIGLLCTTAGIRLDWSTISPDGNVAASIASARGDNTGLHAALRIAAGQPPDPEHSRWIVLLRR